MKIDIASINSAIGHLESQGRNIQNASTFNLDPLAGTFSTVSGFDTVGQTHSTILDVNALASTKAFADRFTNASNTLSTNLADFIDGDQAIAGTLSNVGLSHPLGNKLTSLRSGGGVRNTDTTPFHAALPAVARPGTLMSLCAQFAATDFSVPPSMTSNWTDLASKITSAANSLGGVLSDLSASAETEAISNAIANITTIRDTGLAFASNASLMSGHTTGLGTGSLALGQQTAAVGATYQALMAIRPDAAMLLEQNFLNAFPGLAAAALAPAIPAISMLLPSLSDPNGAAASIGDAQARVPEPQDLTLPASVASAMAEMGYALASQSGNQHSLADEFLRTGPENLEQVLAGQVPTTTATTATAMPPTLNPGGQGLATPSLGAMGPGAAANAGHALPLGLPGGAAATAGPVFGAGASQAAGIGSRPADRISPTTGTPLGMAGGQGQRGAHGTQGLSGSGSARNQLVGGPFRGGAGSMAAPGAPGTGSGSNAIGNTGRPTTGLGGPGIYGAPQSSISNGAANSQGARGFVPGAAMGPGARGASGSKSTAGAVKRVTSAVEREGNLRALLGPGPEVVPGVIGAWVREPRR